MTVFFLYQTDLSTGTTVSLMRDILSRMAKQRHVILLLNIHNKNNCYDLILHKILKIL